ncbi:MAG: hypothetical protein M3254_07450 [Actinomycetota bacterium]|nr:hypothetical protein [Actinomycetota bacterium]
MASKRLGKLPPRYSFILNPYEDVRLSRCPKCEGRTRLRKFVLVILVEGFEGLMALGKTSRFCPNCDLIMVHQDELEHELVVAFESRNNPDVIGNDYMVFGTMDRKVWRKNLRGDAGASGDVLDHIADFKEYLDLHYDPGGWRLPES